MNKDAEEIYSRYLLREANKGTEAERKDADKDKDDKLSEKEKKDANEHRGKHGKSHICATKVKHESFGYGTPIYARHADPDANGDISWYSVVFEHGTEVVDTTDLVILDERGHEHSSGIPMP